MPSSVQWELGGAASEARLALTARDWPGSQALVGSPEPGTENWTEIWEPSPAAPLPRKMARVCGRVSGVTMSNLPSFGASQVRRPPPKVPDPSPAAEKWAQLG